MYQYITLPVQSQPTARVNVNPGQGSLLSLRGLTADMDCKWCYLGTDCGSRALSKGLVGWSAANAALAASHMASSWFVPPSAWPAMAVSPLQVGSVGLLGGQPHRSLKQEPQQSIGVMLQL